MDARLTDKIHEVLKHSLEMRIAWNRNRNVHSRGNAGPDETRDTLGPASEHLHGQTDTVDVGAVVGNDAERKNDQAEFAKATKRREEHSAEQAASSGLLVAVHVPVVTTVDGRCGHNSHTEDLSEEKRDDKTNPDGEEDLDSGLVRGLVDGVVGRIARPSGSKAVHNASHGEDRAQLRCSDAHGDIDECAGVCEYAEDD